jgi:hypothetical protein
VATIIGRTWPGICLRTVLLYCLLAVGAVAAAAASDANVIEAQVKAAYILRFAEYVEWPASTFADAAAPLTIGVVAADRVNAELDQLRLTRKVDGRAVAVRTILPGDPVNGIQMLYVGALDDERLKRVLVAGPAQGVLAITDGDGTLAAGAIISFVQVDRRIRFNVSTAQAERSGLKVSARLLAVAHRVEGTRP